MNNYSKGAKIINLNYNNFRQNESSSKFLSPLHDYPERTTSQIRNLLDFNTSISNIPSHHTNSYKNNKIAEMIQNIFKNITSYQMIKICSYLGFVLSILFICCFMLFLMLKRPNNQLDKYTICLNKLIILSVIILVWYVKTCIFQPEINYQNKIAILFIFICSITILFIGIINHKVRIYGIYIIALIFLIDESSTLDFASSMVGMVMAIHMINNDQNLGFLLLRGHNYRKIIHLTLFGFYKWKSIENLVGNILTVENLNISFIYLGFIIIFLTICGYFKYIYKVNRKKLQIIQLCECLKNLQKNENDTESKILSIEIIHDYLKRMQKKKSINDKLFEIKKLKLKKWNLQDWYYLVNIMIKQQFQRQPTLQLGINMLKCRLMINDHKIYQIIQFLKDLVLMDKRNNINSQYQLLKITLKIQKICFQKFQTNPFPVSHIIRKMDTLYQSFYHQCYQTITLIYQFWAHVVAYKISIDEQVQGIPLSVFVSDYQAERLQSISQNHMQNIILEISQKVKKLQQILKKISGISQSRQEAKALGCIKFLATYSHDTHDDVNHQHFQYSKLDMLTTHYYSSPDFSEYCQTIDCKITKISLKLATKLGYRKLEVVGENLCFLMPKLYVADIQNAVINNNQPHLKIPYLVPIICADNSIILKTITSYIQLDCIHGYRIIYHMNCNIINKDPILIYNVSCNIIEYYNRAFITTFKIQKTKLDSKIRNKLLSPDQIFKDLQLSDKSIQAKLSQGGLQSQYNCRIQIHDICQKKSVVSLQNVRLSLIEKQKQYMIFKVMKGMRDKSILGQINLQNKKQQLSSFSLLKNDTSTPFHLVYKKKSKNGNNYNNNQYNDIVCKIQNPYQSKINAKKIQLNKSNKITGKFLIVIFLFFTIFSLVIEGFVFLKINLQLNNDVSLSSHNNINAINQYTQLMLGYQGHYQYTLLNLHIDELLKLGLDPAIQLNNTGKAIQNNIQQFEQSYLQSLDTSYASSYTYDVGYKSFNITTTTNSTNLFDFSSNILLYGDQDALDFLIHNYDAFNLLSTTVFNSLATVSDNLSFHKNIQLIASSSLIGISLLFLIISTIINYKIQIIRRDIKKIFRIMNKKSMENIFLSLVLIKKKIIQIRQSDCYMERKYKNTIDAYLLTENQKNQDKKQNQQNQVNPDDSTMNIQQKKPSQKSQSKTALNPQQQIQIKQSLRCCTVWRYLLVFLSLACINVFQIIYFNERIQMQFQIIQFQIQNRLISQHLIKQILQTQQVLLTSSLNNFDNYTASNYVNDVWLVNNHKLPSPYFEEYTSTYFSKISGDLCKILQTSQLFSFTFQECQKVGNGLFSYGLPNTIQDTYQTLLISQKHNSSYWFSRQIGHEFAVYQQIFMAQEMVIQINKQKDTNLLVYIKEFHDTMNLKAVYIFFLSCAISILLLLVLFNFKYQTYKLSRIGIGYFLIIPKKILLENQVLDHIRKKQLLKKISTI